MLSQWSNLGNGALCRILSCLIFGVSKKGLWLWLKRQNRPWIGSLAASTIL